MFEEFDTIEKSLETIRKGEIVLVFDDVARENEGDFIVASEKVTPEIINFFAKVGRGLICVSLTEERAIELNLNRMVEDNTATLSTAFTVSVDLLGNGCTTGISASDRAKTVLALVDPQTKPSDLGRPGHIFPLISNPKGVSGRMGHTEAATDLARLAGFTPSGVLVEVMNEDGTMARLDDLKLVAKQYQIPLISIKQLKAHIQTHNL